MHIVELPEDQLDNIVRLANEKTDAMIAGGGDHLASVERTFREAELVWGVWQDGRAPHGGADSARGCSYSSDKPTCDIIFFAV